MSTYRDFVTFLAQQNQNILEEPVRGNLVVLYEIYKRSLTLESWNIPLHLQSYELFVNFIHEFNGVSGGALDIEGLHLKWINFASVFILRDQIDGKPLSIGFKDTSTPEDINLLSLLDEPLLTKVELAFSGQLLTAHTHSDYSTLDSLLKYTSAQRSLAAEKIRLRRQQKQFHEICSDVNHTRILTAALKRVSRKSPDLKMLRKSIEAAPEISNCCKNKIHYIPAKNSHTDVNLGDCSYLDTCHKTKTCRYVHYFTLNPVSVSKEMEFINVENCERNEYTIGECFTEYSRDVLPAQWIDCDVRHLSFLILGKFAAIISDPAWDIHMSLPYGTCKDTELLQLDIPSLQDEGVIFLWVTGRSIETGRKALVKWGYQISDEMLWVKLNQLKRTIVTGRTGHWLNHSKEHLLVGVKGNPIWLNKKIDSEIIVSGTRQTLRKPDEVYDIVERLVGCHARKLEIFGRDHNTRPGWFTIGNQLSGVSIYERDVRERYQALGNQL